MMRYRWRYVQDAPGAADHYAISPWWGTLIKTAAPLPLPALGLSAARRGAPAFDDGAFLSLPTPPRCAASAAGGMIATSVRLLLAMLPLMAAIHCLAVLFPRRRRAVGLSDATRADLIARQFGVASDGQCLPRTLCRFAACRRLGQADLVIVLGVFTPTDEMHAWLEIDGVPLLECPDFLGHYQASVRYHAA